MRDINYKYFLYARKSSESEDRQMASIEDQIAEVKKIAEKYNLKVIEIISESKSAKEPGREEFNSMLKRMHKGEAQGILTWKLNRLARNPIDGGQISWMLQQNIIKHIQTFEREYNPSDNVLLMQVEFGMANQYVKDLSLDIRRGMRQKAERGWYPISRLAIGYIHNPKLVKGFENEIIPDNLQFPILRKLWDLVLTGKYSISDIRIKANSMGLRNPSGKLCSKNTFYYIFSNEFYCGYYYWKDKEGNIIRYKGKHESIVTLSEFQKVQAILYNKPFPILKERENDFPYRGIIKCGECGCTVTPDHKLQIICTRCKYKYSFKHQSSCPRCGMKISEMVHPSIIDILYYHCNKSKGYCSQKSVTQNQIENVIKEELEKITIPVQIYNWAIDELKRYSNNDKDEKHLLQELVNKKKYLENRLSGLVNLRADGEITSDQFNISLSSTQKELSAIEIDIDRSQTARNDSFEQKLHDYNLLLDILKRFKNGDNMVRTDIVREFVSNLVLLDKKLCITMKKSIAESISDIQRMVQK